MLHYQLFALQLHSCPLPGHRMSRCIELQLCLSFSDVNVGTRLWITWEVQQVSIALRSRFLAPAVSERSHGISLTIYFGHIRLHFFGIQIVF
jgi:hypothetical protein